MTIVVNGRFLRARPTGMHRAARAAVGGGRAAGLELEVLCPPGIDDPLVDRALLWGPPGRFGDHAWEQVALPAAARGRVVLSLVNTAPLATRRSAVWIHDLAPLFGPHWFRGHMRAYAWLMRTAATRAELVLAPSSQVARELVELGVTDQRVAVLRTPVDERFAPASANEIDAVRDRLGLARPYLLHVGWPDPRKDVLTAVAAHLDLVRSCPHDLVLAGRAHPTFAPVVLPQAPSIRTVGYVGDEDLPALLSGAAALVFPSVYEGFGLPPLEAVACGTPAIVSDLPALRESTEGGATFVTPGDVSAWTAACGRALAGGLAAPRPPTWTGQDMGRQLRDALAPLS